jgi:hypothetical protein
MVETHASDTFLVDVLSRCKLNGIERIMRRLGSLARYLCAIADEM